MRNDDKRCLLTARQHSGTQCEGNAAVVAEFQLGSFRHLSYSPDIAPSDLCLFVHLKKHVASQKFHKDEEVKNKVIIACAGGIVL